MYLCSNKIPLLPYNVYMFLIEVRKTFLLTVVVSQRQESVKSGEGMPRRDMVCFCATNAILALSQTTEE